ncbi:MAG: hypothetical protein ABSF18_07800 [Gammaproteobacteria bacterium]|jgi:hypothetical protein
MKLRTEINNLATQGGLSDAEYEASVLSSVTAHLAEAAPFELSYYTFLAKFELIHVPKILSTPTTSSSFFGGEVDPLQSIRQQSGLLKQALQNNLADCVNAIKKKIETEAASYEGKANKLEATIAAQSQVSNGNEEKLSEDSIQELRAQIPKLKEQADKLRQKKTPYDALETQVRTFLDDSRTELSKEASQLLGQLRLHISATKGFPQTFADWNQLAINALTPATQKANAVALTSITSILSEINKYQSLVEKTVSKTMLERTTVNDAQTMAINAARAATDVFAQKEAAEQRAREEGEAKLKAQKEAEEHRRANELLQEELEKGSRRTLGNGYAPAQSDRQHGSQDPFNDFIAMLEFWSLERAFLIIILMSEWRRQKDYADKNMSELTKGHYPNAEATFQKLETMINNLATEKVHPYQAIAEVQSIKISAYDRVEKKQKRRQLQAASYLGRLALVLQRYNITLANEKVGKYLQASNSSRYELMQRFIELFADNGPYSLLPRSTQLVTNYQKESKVLIENIVKAQAQENAANHNSLPLAIVSSQASAYKGALKTDDPFDVQKQVLKKSVEERKYGAAKSGSELLTKQTEDAFKTNNTNGTKPSSSTAASGSQEDKKPIVHSFKEKTAIKRRHSFSGFAASSLTLSQ